MSTTLLGFTIESLRVSTGPSEEEEEEQEDRFTISSAKE
jgi:hypothetical protein